MSAIVSFIAVSLLLSSPAALAEETPTATPTAVAPFSYPRSPTPTPTVNTRPLRAPDGLQYAASTPLPTTIAVIPEPSAFFVPRLITATVGFADSLGARLQGRVLDWRGNGMPGVAVRVTFDRGERFGLTRDDGSYTFDALPAGTYAVAIAGYQGVAVLPLPVDGSSIYIVEFIEGPRPTTPTATPTRTATAAPQTPTVVAQSGTQGTVITPKPAAGASAPARDAALGTPTPRPETPLLSDSAREYLSENFLTPFILGAAGSYVIFLIGIFGARLRR